MVNILVNEMKKYNLNEVKVIDSNNISISKDVRAMCEMNHCGCYNKNWQCPPGSGNIDELKEKINRYKNIIVFSSVTPVEDSFDFEGMGLAQHEHSKKCDKFKELALELSNTGDVLVLGAGACTVCERCSYVDNMPCRLPHKARGSMEAHGIDVVDLTRKCGMKYLNGENTVTYFGLLLFN